MIKGSLLIAVYFWVASMVHWGVANAVHRGVWFGTIKFRLNQMPYNAKNEPQKTCHDR